ncbi:DUF2911 domain-containing protein [Niabella ginsengisoli]|uniref:DUF2911 domain-containing protein n=1 Tax=Niabella ginsengisoli TaxID=522298 RepID=A0ABS9SPC7_9BACT|nr:DUF2911 domain-containing protein [Niabella ginsengisoli]MCH5600263.1 DUF2911 domain-containing protein [Niabella ginsengisoli]
MKKFLLLSLSLITILFVNAQDKPAPKSPPATTKAELASGAVVTITYSQPSVKGRTIGKDLEPLPGQVWRTGANKATVFEVSKDVTVEGKGLPAGKYALFTLVDGKTWTVIFNKTWDTWGAFKYKEAEDALRINVTSEKAAAASEKLNITAGEDGVVTLLWGDNKVSFTVK